MVETTQKLVTAEELAKKQRAVSVAEFFEKNRHLLGFDNMTKSLLTVVKEAVDNSLDACEESGILPEISVVIKDLGDNRYKVIVEDNGPGIVKAQIAKIFGKLLYGSKFGRGRQSRGQQGIGISSAVLYSQLTTGKPTIIYSRPKADGEIHKFTLKINTKENEPEIVSEEIVEKGIKHTGTKIEMIIEGRYIRTGHSVDEYIKQTAVSTPWASITYTNPDGEKLDYPRAVGKLPVEAKEIKPHPHGVELGVLMRMLKATDSKTLKSFLQNDFCRVGSTSAEEICRLAGVESNRKPQELAHEEEEKLIKAMQKVQLMRPPTDCLSPIGADKLEEGLKETYNPEYVQGVTRSPVVYRGNPFLVEAAIAYGGDLAEKAKEADGDIIDLEGSGKMSPVKLLRFGNKIPLLYEQSACAITKSVTGIKWKRYGLEQPGRNIPYGPAVIVVHVASTWVPYTSESKEAVASYDEIINEIKLALQECARGLSKYVATKQKGELEDKKRKIFKIYSGMLASSLSELTGNKRDDLEKKLLAIAETMYSTGKDIKEAENEIEGQIVEENVVEEDAEEI